MFVQQKKKILKVLTELQEFASSLWALRHESTGFSAKGECLTCSHVLIYYCTCL